jgi:hypothetical protein
LVFDDTGQEELPPRDCSHDCGDDEPEDEDEDED